ncbi:Sugar transport protein 7 [Cytospora mali]|uniref:Sugar transport protein 7 n=1 Tax=Cytospora mali TaxID=578113 RepID=A0A194W1W2_CYTMA|nr:Sugar transport protein 7 [Valsa mali]
MTEKRNFIDRFRAQVEYRNLNDRATIEGPLVHLDDRELQHDVREFSKHLPDVEYDELLRAARVAKDIRTYDEVARNMATQTNLLVSLEEEEKKGLVSEQDELRGQFGQILPVVLTVGCAAFLQGHVQASINCASIYAKWPQSGGQQLGDWKLGAMNASPFFAAAVIGAPSALLFNYWIGRRGAITVAAVMILASSLGAAWTTSWWQLLCVRIVNGVGMGVKAVSTPILAGEIAFTQWRGSSTLMWQLWVAFGIAIGSCVNLAIAAGNHAPDTTNAKATPEQSLALKQILGAPFVPAVILLLQALRDLYLIHKSVELDQYRVAPTEVASTGIVFTKAGLTYASSLRSGFVHSFGQYRLLLSETKLKNAVISTCVVALAQQLCGINVFAFYSDTFFTNSQGDDPLGAMAYSAGFGAVNFLFGLLAIRRIDTWGRRKLMLTTLPLMSLFLAAAALLFINGEHLIPTVVFIYLFAAVYSPSLGPIPFTLASESFPLAQREAGCSIAISVNLFFAGVLTLVYPRLDKALKHWGGLAIFSGLNLAAMGLVFFLVEETKGFSLEDLTMVFAVPKRKFVMFQLGYLKYLWRRHALGSKEDEPEFYNVAFHRRNMTGQDEDSELWED